jgi:hypothetical protein
MHINKLSSAQYGKSVNLSINTSTPSFVKAKKCKPQVLNDFLIAKFVLQLEINIRSLDKKKIFVGMYNVHAMIA